MVRHLYQRTITRNGKSFKAWYYWFYDEDGKQVRKSCGQNGKPCIRKRDAEAFIASLDAGYEIRQPLKDMFTGMYNFDSEFMIKFRLKGRENVESTIKTKQRLLKLILTKYGNRYPDEISLGEIDSWLLTFKRSNSWRNQILSIFKDIYLELYNFKKIQYLPRFQNFSYNDKKERGVLTIEEIKKLFPPDYNEIVKIWRWRTKSHEPDWQIFMFATMIFTALSTGMRKGEFRALKYSQFVADNAILINCRLDHGDKEINKLKKGTDINKKWRVTVVPERTVEMLKYMDNNRRDHNRYLFTFHGHPWGSVHIGNIFKEILQKNGIDTQARNITLHSLRYTYNTIMKSKIDNVDLRIMMGHVHANMTEYYDKSKALDHLEELQRNKNIIDNIWN